MQALFDSLISICTFYIYISNASEIMSSAVTLQMELISFQIQLCMLKPSLRRTKRECTNECKTNEHAHILQSTCRLLEKSALALSKSNSIPPFRIQVSLKLNQENIITENCLSFDKSVIEHANSQVENSIFMENSNARRHLHDLELLCTLETLQ